MIAVRQSALSILILYLFCGFTAAQKIDGLTMVAPPRAFDQDPFDAIVDAKANWVCFVPYGFTRLGQAGVYRSDGQWWGETPRGISACIDMAQSKNLKIMLKPQVFIPGGWVGEMDYDNEADWLTWEREYRAYIMTFVNIAADKDVEIFCVGTEYKIAARKREAFWRELIKDIRDIYDGKLVYSSNWDEYARIPFWDALDYIGISAYFPLDDSSTPSTRSLLRRWRPIARSIKKLSKKLNRPVLFTEYGYLSVDGCAGKSWLLEKRVNQLDINEEAQANAMEALYTTFWKEPYWAGGFLWKWFPNMMGHEGYPERDYTPQGKKSLDVLSRWYSQND